MSTGVASSWEAIYDNVVGFLEAQGRMKFVRPLYRNLYRTGTHPAVHPPSTHASCRTRRRRRKKQKKNFRFSLQKMTLHLPRRAKDGSKNFTAVAFSRRSFVGYRVVLSSRHVCAMISMYGQEARVRSWRSLPSRRIVRRTCLVFQFSLCLSQACLGK